jgi:hypothetical protein
MKDVSEITTCTVDYGSFLSLADKLGEKVARSLYYSPFEDEFRKIERCAIGSGLEHVERCDEFMDPEVLKEIDCFIFPDVGWGGLQQYLRSIGKPVWGGMGASDYELFRTQFLKMLAEVGLPVPPSKVIHGMTALCEYLKENPGRWVKVNRFRANMETWFSIDWEHSQQMLRSLAKDFGGMGENIVFVVQEPIKNVEEVGYDGYSVDGQFPDKSFFGFEKKNQLYLGAWLHDGQLPKQVRTVNEAIAPLLAEIGYRNFTATEIRGRFFTDPTFRMAGQTQEHYLETCTNLPEIIWAGAQGQLVQPQFAAKFVAEATLHYTPGTDDWMILDVPDELKRWVKCYYYCGRDGVYHFPPRKSDELGVVLGLGNTVEKAIDQLKQHYEALAEHNAVCTHIEEFAPLIQEIEEAQAKGIKFSDAPLPDPSVAIT